MTPIPGVEPTPAAKPLYSRLWAPILTTSYGTEWVDYQCLARTRAECKRLYLEGVVESARKAHLKRARFIRVDIVRSPEAGGQPS